MAVKVFNRKDFERAISIVVGLEVNLKDKVGKPIIEQLDFIQKMLCDSMNCICYEKTSVPEGYNVDYEIRKFFKELMAAVSNGIVNNSVIQNLRDVGDSPTWILDVFTSYLLDYTKKLPSTGYLEEKRIEITKWLKEIANFGYKSEDERKKEFQKTPQK